MFKNQFKTIKLEKKKQIKKEFDILESEVWAQYINTTGSEDDLQRQMILVSGRRLEIKQKYQNQTPFELDNHNDCHKTFKSMNLIQQGRE